MARKHYVTAQELLDDSYRLADKIYGSGFRPDFLVGIWRGGAPVGIAVQEFLSYKGIETDHIPVRTSGYTNGNTRKKTIRVHAADYLASQLRKDSALLIIDDVWDTGLSIQEVRKVLRKKVGKRMPQDIRIATLYWKPANSKAPGKPYYFMHKTDAWVVFPHELHGMDKNTLRRIKSPALKELWD